MNGKDIVNALKPKSIIPEGMLQEAQEFSNILEDNFKQIASAIGKSIEEMEQS